MTLRSARVLVVLLLVVAVLAPVAVIAAGGHFVDDETSIFENDINWMADNGITQGCNPPTNDRYCPNDNVTRGQMAAFMARLSRNEVVDAADSVKLDGKAAGSYQNPLAANDVSFGLLPAFDNSNQPRAMITIDAPTAGFLLINASGSVYDPDSQAQVYFWLQVDDTECKNSSPHTDSVAYGWATAPNGGGRQGIALTGAASVDAGSHTVTLCSRAPAGNTQMYQPSLTAMFTSLGSITTTP